jgi:hypothetical protein
MSTAMSGASEAARRILADAIRRAPHGLESRIAGSSMAPAIPDGATIRIAPVPDAGYRAGMVVACLSAGDGLFAHRVVRVVHARGRDFVLTVGDGWTLCDPPTALERVIGVVAEWRAEGEWQAPRAEATRGRWNAACSRLSTAVVRTAMRVHPEIARHVAGGCLHVGSWLKSLRGLPRR